MTHEELRVAREELGLTQLELAVALGVAPSTVYRWETGRSRIPAAAELLIRRELKETTT